MELKKEIEQCPNCNFNNEYSKTTGKIKPNTLCYLHNGKSNFKRGYKKGYKKSREEELKFLNSLVLFVGKGTFPCSACNKNEIRINKRISELKELRRSD